MGLHCQAAAGACAAVVPTLLLPLPGAMHCGGSPAPAAIRQEKRAESVPHLGAHGDSLRPHGGGEWAVGLMNFLFY